MGIGEKCYIFNNFFGGVVAYTTLNHVLVREIGFKVMAQYEACVNVRTAVFLALAV